MLTNILVSVFGNREEERDMLVNTVPISTRYKNKWAVNLFTKWIRDRKNHSAALEQTSLNISLDDIQDLDVEHWRKWRLHH